MIGEAVTAYRNLNNCHARLFEHEGFGGRSVPCTASGECELWKDPRYFADLASSIKFYA